MANEVNQGHISLAVAIGWHMQSNHYPPHPVFMNAVALRAIELANAGDWDADVELPEGVEWRDGSRLPTVTEVVESFHLDSFIEWQEDL